MTVNNPLTLQFCYQSINGEDQACDPTAPKPKKKVEKEKSFIEKNKVLLAAGGGTTLFASVSFICLLVLVILGAMAGVK